MTRLTQRRLEAMSAALSAMLAGDQGEGDWPEDVSFDDMDSAHTWVLEQLRKREKK